MGRGACGAVAAAPGGAGGVPAGRRGGPRARSFKRCLKGLQSISGDLAVQDPSSGVAQGARKEYLGREAGDAASRVAWT